MSERYLMPFGKYKGEPVADLPRKYLFWLQKNCELHGELKQAVALALKGEEYIPPATPAEIEQAIEAIVGGTK